jgi:hypothetical protein
VRERGRRRPLSLSSRARADRHAARLLARNDVIAFFLHIPDCHHDGRAARSHQGPGASQGSAGGLLTRSHCRLGCCCRYGHSSQPS